MSLLAIIITFLILLPLFYISYAGNLMAKFPDSQIDMYGSVFVGLSIYVIVLITAIWMGCLCCNHGNNAPPAGRGFGQEILCMGLCGFILPFIVSGMFLIYS